MSETEQNEKTTDYNDFNRQLIEEFRANGGKVSGMFAGAPLLLLTTTGAKSGSAAGSSARLHDRQWPPGGDRLQGWRADASRLVPQPARQPGGHGRSRHGDLSRARHDRQRERNDSGSSTRWRRQMPNFAEYQRNTTRKLPVIVLERAELGPPSGPFAGIRPRL